MVPRDQACPRILDTANVLLHSKEASVVLHLLGLRQLGDGRKLAADEELVCPRFVAQNMKARVAKRHLKTRVRPIDHSSQRNAA